MRSLAEGEQLQHTSGEQDVLNALIETNLGLDGILATLCVALSVTGDAVNDCIPREIGLSFASSPDVG